MFMWMCIVSEMVWCTSFFVWGQGTRRKTIHFVCTQNFCGGGVEMGWEWVDYHGVSKYNDGW